MAKTLKISWKMHIKMGYLSRQRIFALIKQNRLGYNLFIQQMEEKPLTNAQLEKGTSRRSRKDEEGRDFSCGCGKRYLSYPALYTHIKTKHDGVQPQGTQKTGYTAVIKKPKGKNEDQSIKNIYLNFVQREDLKILNEFQGNYQGQVSFSTRIRKDSVTKEFYECYYNFIKQQQQVKLTPDSSLDLVLTMYTLNIGEYVNEKLYDYYLIFARLVRGCYMEYGQEIYSNCFSRKQSCVAYLQAFEVSKIKYFPIICDFLTRYYIPYCESAKEYKDVNISLIELLLFDFCQWLLKRKLTIVSVKLKKEYILEPKPYLLPKFRTVSQKNDAYKEEDLKQQDNLSEQQKKQKQMGEQSDQSNGQQMDQQPNDQEQAPQRQKMRGQRIKTISIINNSNQYDFQKHQQKQKKNVQQEQQNQQPIVEEAERQNL